MRCRGIVAILFLCSLGALAIADPEAEQLFRDGRKFMKEGKLADACDHFERSYRLEPKSGTLLNLADCQEQLGHTASAWDTFLRAKELAVQAHDKRREAEANRRAAAVEGRLAKLTLVVDHPVAGLVIRRNDAILKPAAWNMTAPLDPGEYRFEASAPGYLPWSTTTTLAPAQHATVEMQPLVEDPHATRPIGVTTPVGPVPPPRVVQPVVVAAEPMLNRELGIGVLFGASERENALVGMRVQGAMVVPGGQLRGIGSGHYTRTNDGAFDMPPHPTFHTDTVSLALTIEYVWMPLPQLAFGGGIGIGADLDFPNEKGPVDGDLTDIRKNDVGTFWTMQISPVIARLRRGTIEAGLHVQFVKANTEFITDGVATVDWFVW